MTIRLHKIGSESVEEYLYVHSTTFSGESLTIKKQARSRKSITIKGYDISKTEIGFACSDFYFDLYFNSTDSIRKVKEHYDAI